MLRILPDLYLHIGQTHVHHLNFGIFILSFIGAYFLFIPKRLIVPNYIALLYGAGLGLTFDEFGMWFHLGGGYWQRASYDLIILIASGLSLLTISPKITKQKYWLLLGMMIPLIYFFLWLSFKWINYHDSLLIFDLQQLEIKGPN